MTWELVINYGTQEDYDFLKANLERAWFNVGVDPDGHHWVSSSVPQVTWPKEMI